MPTNFLVEGAFNRYAPQLSVFMKIDNIFRALIDSIG